MKTLQELKDEFSQYSVKDLKLGIFLYTIGGLFFTELSVLIFSSLPFVIFYLILSSFVGFSAGLALIYLIIHLIFYTFYVRRFNDENSETRKEAKLIINALKELKSEKSIK